jgi:hypothetical protein
MANLTPAVMLPVRPGVYCETWPMLEVGIVPWTRSLLFILTDTVAFPCLSTPSSIVCNSCASKHVNWDPVHYNEQRPGHVGFRNYGVRVYLYSWSLKTTKAVATSIMVADINIFCFLAVLQTFRGVSSHSYASQLTLQGFSISSH